jgi:hypothetical protein
MHDVCGKLQKSFESTNHTHENTGAGHNFIPNPKPQFLSGIVTYEDDQTAIFQSEFLIFLWSHTYFLFSSSPTNFMIYKFHDDAMITPPQQASS